MLKNVFSKSLLVTAAVAILAFGPAPIGQAASGSTTTTYTYFTWNGYTFKIPVYTQTQPAQTTTPTQNTTTTQPTQTTTPTQPTNSVTTSPVASETVISEVQQVVSLVNAEHAKAGLAPLKVNTSLAKMAQVKAEDTRDNKYFSHTSPTYGSPFAMMKTFGISYSYAGENIAAGQKTPEEVMKGWMNSPGHKANILSKNFTEIGVGLAKGGSYGTYWVQEFIRP